jgi:hypothetical protein
VLHSDGRTPKVEGVADDVPQHGTLAASFDEKGAVLRLFAFDDYCGLYGMMSPCAI